jgi:hypothetical protein
VPAREPPAIRTFLLCHRHAPAECRAAFAAWKGFDSPLRRISTMGSCPQGGHELFWRVQAADGESALAQLPPYLASRTNVVEVTEVAIP